MVSASNHSFLRWAGSKRKSVPYLRQFWSEDFDRYVEPFAGSASLFFSLEPQRALLSDLNGELMATLQTVRDYPVEVFYSLRSRPVSKTDYYRVRATSPESLEPVARASRFIYLNRFCFNGIYRTNRKGEFNVPFSGEKTGGKPTLAHLLECARMLKGAQLLTGDFELILRTHATRGDFIFLDPPYATGARRIFREYASQSFEVEDLTRLQALLVDLEKAGAAFVLTYAYCPEAIEAFSKWNKTKHFVQRNIAGFAKERRTAAELLVTNLSK